MDTTRAARPTRLPRHPRTGGRLRRGLAGLVIGGLAVAGTTACDPNAPANCAVDCIQFVSANAAGDQVMVAGKGGVFAEVTLYSDAARTKVVGYARNFQLLGYPTMPITKAYQGLPGGNPVPVQLAPATTYHYTVRATANGGPWVESGSFTTQQRTVKVTVTKIELYDDSDLTGAGELSFHLRANGGAATRFHQNLNWASYNVKDLNHTETYTGLLPDVTIQVRGSDDDCTFSTCTAPAHRWDAVGSNGDTQWSTATKTVKVPGEGSSGSFVMGTPGTSLGDVGFNVWITWSVSYYPA